MFRNLSVFKIAHAMTAHAAIRQKVVAQNLANADTPGYAARRVVSFESILNADQNVASGFRTRRLGHLQPEGVDQSFIQIDRTKSANPNGNSVSLEEEMLRAVETKQQHDRAVAIYRSSLDLLRLSLGRR